MTPQEEKLIIKRLYAIRSEVAKFEDGDQSAQHNKLIGELIEDLRS